MSLRMSARSRKEVLEQARQRYGKRGREGRSRLLDEVCELCGYERKYAIKVLRGKRAIIGSKGRKRGGSQAIYGEAEREVIKAISRFHAKIISALLALCGAHQALFRRSSNTRRPRPSPHNFHPAWSPV